MRQLQFDNSLGFAVLERWGRRMPGELEPATFDGYLLDDHVFVARPNAAANKGWRILVYPWGLELSDSCDTEAMTTEIAQGISALKLDWPKLMEMTPEQPKYRAAIGRINRWVHDYFERDFEFVPIHTFVGRPLGD